MNPWTFLVLVLAVLICSPGVGARERDSQGRRHVPQNWWESVPSIYLLGLVASEPRAPSGAT